ncbi:hypothetical protein KIH39_23180 [Telmatocola sphagniphila]|uniref:Uncharacterized protein n=1 Tax=Telmatocola sphagniphila TaxID=1123043 RepID=A0A8E6B5H7_9BACT|nr:hypothetical protein [Telmatocola sphagniphila]QVL31712.1 hypothetical protein KIH39_23180 [Telmatocola sphagniphila]
MASFRVLVCNPPDYAKRLRSRLRWEILKDVVSVLKSTTSALEREPHPAYVTGEGWELHCSSAAVADETLNSEKLKCRRGQVQRRVLRASDGTNLQEKSSFRHILRSS